LVSIVEKEKRESKNAGLTVKPLSRVRDMWLLLPRKYKKFMERAERLRKDMSKNFMRYREEFLAKDCAQVKSEKRDER